MAEELKFCWGCKTTHALSLFNKDMSKPDGLNIYCKTHLSVQRKEWRLANPEKAIQKNARERANRQNRLEAARKREREWRAANPTKVKAYNLKTNYNMTVAQFEAILLRQHNQCAICHNEFTDTLVPCVDHRHSCCPGRTSCGECIRGLLCQPCNRILGVMGDDSEKLLRASYYVRTD